MARCRAAPGFAYPFSAGRQADHPLLVARLTAEAGDEARHHVKKACRCHPAPDDQPVWTAPRHRRWASWSARASEHWRCLYGL